jgi:hypothetical protein
MGHEHRFDLVLGADGHGLTYGNYAGYVRRCGGMGSGGCGEYAPDYVDYLRRRREQKIAEAENLLRAEGRL